MRGRFRNVAHLMPLALAFVAALALFFVLRRAVVPEGFGLYGHYRAPAVDEVRMLPVAFAGQAACADCHAGVVETRNSGKHRGLSCEGCHGPLASHVQDPSAKPKLPAATLCTRCHETDAAKPRQFPQVDSREHSGGESCTSCHKPHQPAM